MTVPSTAAELDKPELEYFGSVFVSGLTANRRMCWTKFNERDRTHLVLDMYTTNESERIALDAVEQAWRANGLSHMADQVANARLKPLPCMFCCAPCILDEDEITISYRVSCSACDYITPWYDNKKEVIGIHNKLSHFHMNSNLEAQHGS